ncbi:hypothetical protein Lesp02_80950 [Lentzea sp. NBRC 105346]|uniref:SAM-dependent methyltransferase n=1 Tax=Lentzea sp. NBRC 105346 TaxID=3032205 RepID=UPI0024A12A05|nr:SAM-dependent methyltransferase [Lentzea sp. NBRC 105346]GLZ35908.1 hypothetical protein Lesp02_80950 [Lentzea sp. NBRC 105346]
MAVEHDWVPQSVDVSVPSAARMYDYLLGGAHNFAVDRELGDKIETVMPHARSAARVNRKFLGRAVRFMMDQGIRQFIDIGSGIPTVSNVHDVAQAEHPECKVVYVDRDPVAVAHSELILYGNDRAGIVHADLRDPDSILRSAEVRRLIDFEQPVGLLMLLLLHWVPDEDDPWKLVRHYRDAVPSGSYLAISHFTLDDVPDYVRLAAEAVNKSGGDKLQNRPKAQVAEMFGDFELAEPGLVRFGEWRPSGPGDISDDPETNTFAYAGVGRKP